MLTAGDEFGRTQARQQQRLCPGQRRSPGSTGTAATATLEAFCAGLAALRRAAPGACRPARCSPARAGPDGIPDVAWLTPGGSAEDRRRLGGRPRPGARHGARPRRRRPAGGALQPERARGRLPPARPRRPPLAEAPDGRASPSARARRLRRRAARRRSAQTPAATRPPLEPRAAGAVDPHEPEPGPEGGNDGPPHASARRPRRAPRQPAAARCAAPSPRTAAGRRRQLQLRHRGRPRPRGRRRRPTAGR